jgi:hypothetical protein
MVSLSILPLLMLVSCSGSPEEQAATPPSPPTGQASPPPVAPPPATPPAGSQATTPPVISDKEITQKGLVPSTNPEQRLKEIKQARNNPFGLIPIIAQVVPSGQSDNKPNGSSSDSLKNVNTTKNVTTTKNANSVSTFASSQKQAKQGLYCMGKNRQDQVLAMNKGKNSSVNIVPPEVDTRDAKGVRLFGVINFREGPVAIVQLRNQSVAQSITSKSLLSDPSNPSQSVSVKSIQGGADGLLKLEQNGKIITRGIAEEVPVLEPPAPGKVDVTGGQPPEIVVVQEANTDGFGRVTKNGVTLMLTEAKIEFTQLGESNSEPVYVINGTICNDSSKDVKVSSISLSILGQNPSGGKPIFKDAATPALTKDGTPYRLEKEGGLGQFDAPLLKLRGSNKEKIYIRLEDWN